MFSYSSHRSETQTLVMRIRSASRVFAGLRSAFTLLFKYVKLLCGRQGKAFQHQPLG